jgi:hypothetical protein
MSPILSRTPGTARWTPAAPMQRPAPGWESRRLSRARRRGRYWAIASPDRDRDVIRSAPVDLGHQQAVSALPVDIRQRVRSQTAGQLTPRDVRLLQSPRSGSLIRAGSHAAEPRLLNRWRLGGFVPRACSGLVTPPRLGKRSIPTATARTSMGSSGLRTSPSCGIPNSARRAASSTAPVSAESLAATLANVWWFRLPLRGRCGRVSDDLRRAMGCPRSITDPETVTLLRSQRRRNSFHVR